jgi:hypothetical protein
LSLDLARQRSRVNLGILNLSPLDKTHDLRGELVRALRSAPTRQQSCKPLSIERCFSLIERWAGQSKKCGGVGFGGAILTHVTQHLVFDLHEILRVEEGAGLEPGGAHALGVAVEALQSLETLGLGVPLSHAPHHGVFM